MKKTQILIITLLVAFSSRSQNHVKMDEAKSAAVCFAIKENLAGNLTNTRFDDSVVYPIIDDGDTLLFLYPVKQYYIIVSRFKCFPPILGYFEDPTHYNYQSDIVDNNYFVQRYCYYSKKTMERKNDFVSPQWDNLFKNNLKNTPSREYTYSAMLLKDEFGKSVLRFPDWNINSPMPDTLLISPTYKFQSISPIQQLSACVLYSGGYDPLDSYNVLNLQQWSIHFHVRTCLEKQIEVLESYNNIVDPIWEECALVTVSYKNDLFFETYPFESRIVTKESVCTKY